MFDVIFVEKNLRFSQGPLCNPKTNDLFWSLFFFFFFFFFFFSLFQRRVVKHRDQSDCVRTTQQCHDGLRSRQD